MVEKIEKLVNKSLTIAIVKKNILDILLRTLKKERIVVKEQLLVNLINEIEFDTFEDLRNYKDNRFRYSQKIEQIVSSILRQYLNTIHQSKF